MWLHVLHLQLVGWYCVIQSIIIIFINQPVHLLTARAGGVAVREVTWVVGAFRQDTGVLAHVSNTSNISVHCHTTLSRLPTDTYLYFSFIKCSEFSYKRPMSAEIGLNDTNCCVVILVSVGSVPNNAQEHESHLKAIRHVTMTPTVLCQIPVPPAPTGTPSCTHSIDWETCISYNKCHTWVILT